MCQNTEYPELRDALDVRYSSYFASLGINILPISNNPNTTKQILDKVKPEGIILSGGNDLNEFAVREHTEDKLIEFCIKKNKPIIGICRGAQKLNQYFGGSANKIQGHVGTLHEIWDHRERLSASVNSFHNYGICKHTLSAELLPICYSNDGSIEAFRHIDMPILGVMWHPERMNDACVVFENLMKEVL